MKHSGEFGRELAWGARIGELYPGDPGIIVALALNLVVLRPGEALYLPDGNLHAYLEGTGVELMASSDNVLRGGLTSKHIDVTELLDVLDFHATQASLVPTTTVGNERFYATPAREFALSRVELAGETARLGPVSGPEILVATAGALDARRGGDTAHLAAGSAVFLPFAGGDVELSGTGTAFRARVNDGRA
jgi:mannose-6-phosphate isomerase